MGETTFPHYGSHPSRDCREDRCLEDYYRTMGQEWEGLKLNFLQTREARIKSTLMQLNELDESIAAREQGARYPTVKEADIRRKLTADLEALEQEASVRDIVNVSRDILDYVRAIDLEKAKMLSDYFDSYIQERLKWVK